MHVYSIAARPSNLQPIQENVLATLDLGYSTATADPR